MMPQPSKPKPKGRLAAVLALAAVLLSPWLPAVSQTRQQDGPTITPNYKDADRTAEAIQIYEQVRDRRIVTLGPDHADTLSAKRGLADAYWYAGRRNESIALLQEVLDRQATTVGPDHQVIRVDGKRIPAFLLDHFSISAGLA